MIALFLTLLLLDQATKAWVLEHSVTHALFLTQNTGIAFGLFGNQTGYILIANILFLVSIWLLRERLFSESIWQRLALVFVLAGGVGNGFDRLARGYVVDFLQCGPIPTFNVADVWVNIGVVLILLHFFIYDRRPRS